MKNAKTKIFIKSNQGFFGENKKNLHAFGGQYVPEILYPALYELEKAYKNILSKKSFQQELKKLSIEFIGRPTPLIYAKNASKLLQNEIYLKFEGLANTGAHKINNALGQVLLAKKMGKKSIIAETGAGQHGLAVSAACAKLQMPCKIFMGAQDMKRQFPNVFNMELLGAQVCPVETGSQTLKDAVNESLKEWSKDCKNTFYVLGSALGPHPYPDMVRDFQSIISKELKRQMRFLYGKKPDIMIACVGGGSNALGFFAHFLKDSVRLIGVEAGGRGEGIGEHAKRMNSDAHIGIIQGYKSYFLSNQDGNLLPTHSISAGLDYAGISPQLAHLHEIKRVEFIAARDNEALDALEFFAKHEGIIAALESSHALAGVLKVAKEVKQKVIIAHVSGRGDKDLFITAKALKKERWMTFLQEEIKHLKGDDAN